MITGYNLCVNLLQAIATNATLVAYCNTKFSKQPKLYYAVDELNPPSKDDAPFICLWQDSAEFSEPTTINRSLVIGCVVSDSTLETGTYVTKGYKGFDTIENFERLVFNAVDAYIKEASMNVSILELGDAVYKHYYPLFHSVRRMQIITERN